MLGRKRHTSEYCDRESQEAMWNMLAVKQMDYFAGL